ncbi:hypothetical protein F383_22207 [Gossypium arboreum]|uniref:Uncharacterized protein n=1 Tax=Gossypium arboreum TaxID=29729 RepID=A0A0B0NY51_GOSAR|nr:hypothetical protein F383_22207 [Gossypium arboreum]
MISNKPENFISG